MDGHVIVSSSPSTILPHTEPVKQESETERLEKEINTLKDLLKAQASSSDRKINELTSGTIALKKTLEDTLVQLRQTRKVEPKSDSVKDQWNNLFSPTAKAKEEPTPEEEEMKPEEIEQLVNKKVAEIAQQSYQFQVHAKNKEEELVQRFQSGDYKDLHKHGPKVASLWKMFSDANPNEDPDTRFQRTILAARQMLGPNSSPVPEGGEYQPTGESVSKKTPKTFADQVTAELSSEKERHKQLENYVIDRVRSQNHKLGYDYSKLT